jgi:hypothetical protein
MELDLKRTERVNEGGFERWTGRRDRITRARIGRDERQVLEWKYAIGP